MFVRKMSRYKWLLLMILLFLIIIIFMQVQISQLRDRYSSPAPLPQPIAIYQNDLASNLFEPLWLRDNIYITKTQFGRNLIIDNQQIFFVGSLDFKALPVLNNISGIDGTLKWQSQTIVNEPTILSLDTRNIYIASEVPSIFTVYGRSLGTEIWMKRISFRNTNAEYVFVDSGSLYGYFTPGRLEIFDTNTGKIRRETLSTDLYPIYRIQHNIVYHGTWRQLNATDKLSGQLLWATPILNEEIRIAPVFTEDFIVIQTGFVSPKIFYVVDRTNGAIIWKSAENVASNVSTDDENLFYLTEDSQLIAQNIKSGEVVGELSFSPSLQDMERIDFVNSEFSVVASDGYVLVYFGSGRQLFAFRFSPS